MKLRQAADALRKFASLHAWAHEVKRLGGYKEVERKTNEMEAKYLDLVRRYDAAVKQIKKNHKIRSLDL